MPAFELTPTEIIGQIIGIIAPILTVISYQMKTKKSILLVLTAASVATTVGYLLIGAYSGFVLNIVGIARNIVCIFVKEKSRSAYLTGAAFAVLMCILGATSWQGIHSLLIISGLAINTVFVAIGVPQLLRKSLIFTCTLILIYNIIEFSVGGIVNESLAIISSVIGIIRFRKCENGEAA